MPSTMKGDCGMNFQIHETCPRCFKLVSLARVELNARRPNTVLHFFECARCGPVMMKEILLEARLRRQPSVRDAQQLDK
jgi:hypothetical protein